MRFMKKVKGIRAEGKSMNMMSRELMVRGTADSVGMTLSICDEDENVMFMIPLEPIQTELKMMLKGKR